MGKFDGMDPELVRDLLSEVERAAGQMRTIEGRITRLMSENGLSAQSTHRPVQIAEACDAMVKDVSARVVLLEKKIEQKTTPAPAPGTGEPATPAPKAEAPERDASKPEPPKAEDLRPAVPDSGGNPRIEDQSADDPPKPDSGERDSAPDPKPDAKPDADSKGDERSPRDGGGASGDGRSGAQDPAPDPKPDAGQERDSAPETRPDPKPDADSAPEAKPDADSKGDERPPRDGGGTPGDDPLDTPEKNHPDDIDQTGELRPQVVEVDGVKVLQIPLDPPTAEEVEALLKDIENIPPMDMPTVDGVADGADTRPGQVEPGDPLPSAKPESSVLETAEPAPGQTVQPPGTGGDTGAEGRSGTGGTAPGGSGTPEEAVARWANDGSDVVSAQAGRLDLDALRTLVDNVREIEPLDMPGVQVPDGETWGRGPWTPMDVRPDGPAGEVDPGDPGRPIPPPGASSGPSGPSGPSSGPESA
ncbi:hypothetical protein HS041_11160 [Planomonospora sp. ID67723]|uniref:hypothetical protein n=1 Tax=Planomonospora sp. ID67723 TaxID=2738134 RepID=UPI0018C450B0|nr:hypothetical protein [Planomonospora sp. ID67723]MBG0828323.1 hypothetical protein [Planomonospora sp. ID67723]